MLKDKWPWLLLAVTVFLSSLYEYGYWSTFHFNAFEYFTIESLIKNFAYIILSGASLFAFIPLLGYLPQIIDELRGANSEEVHSEKEIDEFRKNRPKIYYTLSLIGIVGFYGFIGFAKPGWVFGWQFLVFNFSLALYIALEKRLIFAKSGVLRFWIIYYAVFYCWRAYTTGRNDATDIIRNKNFFTVSLSAEEQKDIGYSKVKYLGALGDSYAFITLDNQQTFLVLKSHMPTLRLDRNRKKMGLPR